MRCGIVRVPSFIPYPLCLKDFGQINQAMLVFMTILDPKAAVVILLLLFMLPRHALCFYVVRPLLDTCFDIHAGMHAKLLPDLVAAGQGREQGCCAATFTAAHEGGQHAGPQRGLQCARALPPWRAHVPAQLPCGAH